MRVNFVAQEQIQLVIDGFNKLYEHMIKIAKVDTILMKDFMEPYFKEGGYRSAHANGGGGGEGVLKISLSFTMRELATL